VMTGAGIMEGLLGRTVSSNLTFVETTILCVFGRLQIPFLCLVVDSPSMTTEHANVHYFWFAPEQKFEGSFPVKTRSGRAV